MSCGRVTPLPLKSHQQFQLKAYFSDQTNKETHETL